MLKHFLCVFLNSWETGSNAESLKNVLIRLASVFKEHVYILEEDAFFLRESLSSIKDISVHSWITVMLSLTL